MRMKWNLVIFTIIIFEVILAVKSSMTIDEDLTTASYDGIEDIELEVPQFRSKSIEVSNKTLVVRSGETIRINCGVKGYPKPHVSFYKGDKLLREPTPEDPNPSRVRVERTTLRIFPAHPEDAGIYKCVAQNEHYNTSLTFRLDVIVDNVTKETDSHDDKKSKNEQVSDSSASKNVDPTGPQKPHWTKLDRIQKQLHAEPAGNTVRFHCPVEGIPTPTLTWFKNRQIIQKEDRVGGYKYRNQGQVIILETVVLSDKGMYMCKASNIHGSINHTYELDVIERSASSPILTEGILQNKTAVVGEQVTFKCKVYSDAHPHIEWLKVKADKNGTSYTVLKAAGINTTDSEMEVLILKNVTFADAGEYTCLAGNSIGISHQSAWLKVLPVPPPTTDSVLMNSAPQETNLIIYGMCGLLALLILTAVIVFIYYNHYNGKDPPMLVRIENPDNIPQMTQIEVPTMLYGNAQAWQRICLPVQEPFEFNIQPDLQWELKREDIMLLERLDEGFFGQVFKADLITCSNKQKDKTVCAVKMLKGSRTEKDILDLLTEMDQMKRVGKHKNIINLLGVCTQNGPLLLVTEYAAQGNLRDYLRKNRPQNMNYNSVMPSDGTNPPPENLPPQDCLLSQKDLVSFAFQISRGLEYLAQKKCIHRDLAARNVLVTEERVMKIADFGLARDIRSCDYYRKHTRGHLPYKWMALEAMSDNVFTHATDVWSFGVLLWEIFSLGGSPYPGIKTGELVKFLRSGERLDQPQFASQEMYRLMRDCWEEDPNRRPNFRTLVEDLDRMLAETSTEDYIDFTATADYYDSSDSESSESERSEDDDSVFEPMPNSDSVSDGNVPFNEERDSLDSDPYAAPLLAERPAIGILQNEHARLQSDV